MKQAIIVWTSTQVLNNNNIYSKYKWARTILDHLEVVVDLGLAIIETVEETIIEAILTTKILYLNI